MFIRSTREPVLTQVVGHSEHSDASPYTGTPLNASYAEFFRFMLQFLCLLHLLGFSVAQDCVPKTRPPILEPLIALHIFLEVFSLLWALTLLRPCLLAIALRLAAHYSAKPQSAIQRPSAQHSWSTQLPRSAVKRSTARITLRAHTRLPAPPGSCYLGSTSFATIDLLGRLCSGWFLACCPWFGALSRGVCVCQGRCSESCPNCEVQHSYHPTRSANHQFVSPSPEVGRP